MQGMGQITEVDQVAPRYVGRVIHIALLAPDIVWEIERGEQPAGPNATKLLTSVPLPIDWQAQREMLEIGYPNRWSERENGALRRPVLLEPLHGRSHSESRKPDHRETAPIMPNEAGRRERAEKAGPC